VDDTEGYGTSAGRPGRAAEQIVRRGRWSPRPESGR
jgi:hypothetical protein